MNLNLPFLKKCLVLFLVLTKLNFSFSQIQLSDIWSNYRFYAQSPSIDWLSDSSFISRTDSIRIFTVDKELTSKTVVFPDSISVDGVIEIGVESSIIAFSSNVESLYRHSFQSYVILYDWQQDSILYLSKKKVFNPSLSSDAKFLAYTDKNNIYCLDLETLEEKQLTTDGEWNTIINGRADWVNEEEFGFSKAYYWIPETHQIAYLKYNESEVKTMDIQIWGNDLYPNVDSYKYPKAGEKNSHVSLNILDVETKVEEEIFETDEDCEYIAKLGVTARSGEFYIITNNRLQNEIELITYNSTTKKRHIAYTEKSEKYVEIPELIYFSEEGIILDSYQTGYKHFLLLDTDTSFIDLTPGDFNCQDFLFFDELNEEIYFTALFQNSYTQSICSATDSKVKVHTKDNLWYEANLSKNASFALLTKSSLSKPYSSEIVEWKKLKPISSFDFSPRVQNHLDTLELGSYEFFEIEDTLNNKIQCLKILPPDFDSSIKYPVLMHCYGGPNYQMVTNKWSSFDFFYHQLIAQKGCIVVLADGRGTDGKSLEYRQSTYGQLGKLEQEDQASVAKYLNTLDYVDSSRIGIWGWSFGGYLSALCLLKAPELFSMAIAVAPVTNWRYYDNIYTERYMGLPAENPEGYDVNSPTSYAQNLNGKFLLIHGTADDNVHIQNSYALQNALLKYNKQFETFYYPDKNHGIYGGSTRFNLYQKMLTFIETNLIENGN